MPQFDVSTFPSQIFWLFVCFFIVYTYTSRVTLSKIRAILEARWFETEGKKQHAEELAQEAHKLEDQNEAAIKRAKKEAHDHLEKVSNDMEVMREQRKYEILSMMQNQYHQAEARIQKRRVEILSEIKTSAHIVSKAIVEQLIAHAKTSNTKVPSSEKEYR